MNQMLEILAAPWAMEPRRLLEAQSLCLAQLRGEHPATAPIGALMGAGASGARSYAIENGVAVIPVHGVVMRRAGALASIFGAVSTESIASNLQAALGNSEVRAILLDIDSPGGSVDGPHALAAAIHAARAVKPIAALASGMMASAAYLIGSAASQVYIDDVSTLTGSIGVVTSHFDISKALEQRGVKATEVTAGRYKRIATEHAPLSTEGRQYMQEAVDYHYSLFVNAVARHRGISVDKVLSQMADGRMFIGQQGVEAGLVDGITSRQALISRLGSTKQTPESRSMTQLAPETAAAAQPQPIATRQQLHEAAQAYMESHPGVTYGEAVRRLGRTAAVSYGEMPVGRAAVMYGETKDDGMTQSAPRGFVAEPGRAALHARAQAHQKANPGLSYIDAVKAVQATA